MQAPGSTANGAGPARVFVLRDLTAADRLSIASLASRSRQVVAVDALFSMTELDAVARVVSLALDLHGIDSSIDANERLGVVTVGVLNRRAEEVRRGLPELLEVSQLNGVQSALSRLGEVGAPLSALVTVTDDHAQRLSGSRTTYPLHNGGLGLRLENIQPGVAHGCTSGDTIVSDGVACRGLTAGHCARGYLTESISIGGDHRAGRGRTRGPARRHGSLRCSEGWPCRRRGPKRAACREE